MKAPVNQLTKEVSRTPIECREIRGTGRKAIEDELEKAVQVDNENEKFSATAKKRPKKKEEAQPRRDTEKQGKPSCISIAHACVQTQPSAILEL